MEAELTPNTTEAEIANVIDGELNLTYTEGELTQVIEAEIQLQTFVIAPDNIYILNKVNDQPDWFVAMLEASINGSELADEVADLEDQFSSFEDGITLQIGYLQTADSEINYDLSVLKTSNDTNVAAIQNLDITKITANDAQAISETTIAAWTTAGGGAWFDSQIELISNIAYSAAASTSTLKSSIDTQADKLLAIAGDVEILQKQVDGVVETWFDTHDVVALNGDIILTSEPYATWLTEETRDIHSGDSYVKYELDANQNKVYIASFRFTKTTIDTPYTDPDGYAWIAVSDSRAEEAYTAALAAQATADEKIITYYQSYPPVIEFPELSIGDLWIDSSTTNYILSRYDGDSWVVITDERIEASVTRLDEATVNLEDGTAVATSSLTVEVNNSIAGFITTAGTTSEFKIFADKFLIAAPDGSDRGAPFVIIDNDIYFNGRVSFASLDDTDTLATVADLSGFNGTVIDGGAIITDTLNANTIMADGSITSPNILGGSITGNSIKGGSIKGVTITGSVIKSSWLDLTSTGILTNWQEIKDLYTIPSEYWANFPKREDVDPAETNPNLMYVHDSDGYFRLAKTEFAVTTNVSVTHTLVDIHDVWNYADYPTPVYTDLYASDEYKVDSSNRLLNDVSNITSAKSKIKIASDFNIWEIAPSTSSNITQIYGRATVHVGDEYMTFYLTYTYGRVVSYGVTVNGVAKSLNTTYYINGVPVRAVSPVAATTDYDGNVITPARNLSIKVYSGERELTSFIRDNRIYVDNMYTGSGHNSYGSLYTKVRIPVIEEIY